jgi:hypothetical protein
MQVKVFGPMSGLGPTGDIVSWSPNQVVEVDDSDATAVAFYEGLIAAEVAELLEATKASPAAAGPSTLTEPPKAGPGSSRDAWAGYARSEGLKVTPDMTRDDIIDMVEAAE